MHAIKSRARHAAWRGDNYNPWMRRTFSTKKDKDLERDAAIMSDGNPRERNFAESIHSEDCVDDTRTVGRRNNQDEINKSYGGPRHATTFNGTGSEPNSATGTGSYPPKFGESEISPIEASAHSADTNHTLVTSSDTNPVKRSPTYSEGTRRRKNHHLRFWKKGKVENEDGSSEKKKSRFYRESDKNLTIMSQTRAVLFPQWLTINWLLVLVPVGFAMNYAKQNGIAIFVVNFLAIIPLAGILSYATEEIAMRVGETLGGLLNATFGNAVELIVSVLALVKNEIIIVQTSLIGSMLSNLLLVMGMCFFFGGVNRIEQFFNVTVAQTAASLLALAIGALIIPTAFNSLSSVPTNEPDVIDPATISKEKAKGIAPLSRGTAVILLVVYASYLFFQLKSHVEMYNEPSKKVEKRKSNKKEEGESLAALGNASAGMAATSGGKINKEKLNQKKEEDDDDEETPQLTLLGAIVTLAASTVLVAFCAEFMVDGIQAVTCNGGVSQTFVGLILLPIVGNAAEHATAVTVAIKDKMDLAIGVAVGSSMQIALLVLPFMVVLGWIMEKPTMTLQFDGFQIAILFVAILLVNYLIQDGKTHWLEGVMLMSLYLIISVAAWFYPQTVDLCKLQGQGSSSG